MKTTLRAAWRVGCLSSLIFAPFAAAQRVTLVNVIPNARSNETINDAEPNIAVNAANLLQVAISAFTPNPAGGANAPIYVSNDGGRNWALNAIVPGNNAQNGTGDITLSFGGASNVLYAAILNGNVQLQLNILRTANFLNAAPMAVLVTRNQDDQPYVDAVTDRVVTPPLPDRVYVGNNDISQRANGRTASVDRSINAALAAAPAGFGTLRIESRASAAIGALGSQDGPSVRTAIHSDGTVYAAFFGWRTFGSNNGATNTSDVVVVRDDAWAGGAAPFTALTDNADALQGQRVVRGVRIPSLGRLLGRQRIGSSLTIAVDPRNSSTVYLAWADGLNANNYTIRVRRSLDRGRTWSADLDTVRAATNPSLAINENGTVALLYQQLESARWHTRLKLTDDGFATRKEVVLAQFDDIACAVPCGAGPLGDYAEVMAIEKTFYGVFSGWNMPDRANFPSGVVYQRNADFATRTLLQLDNVTAVAQSIDPFFFVVEPVAATQYHYAPKMICGSQTDPADLRLGRGVYASTVNIANTGSTPARIAKSLALSVPPGDEQPGQVFPIEAPLLDAGRSIAADCNEIIARVFGGVLPAAYIEGSLMIQSSDNIQVTGVYTVAPDATSGVSSVDVEQYQPRRIDSIAVEQGPVVLRTGTFEVAHLSGASVDLDALQGNQEDFLWAWSGNTLTLTPRTGARHHVGGLQAIGKAGCESAPLVSTVITLAVDQIPAGTNICMQTDLGRIAELRMVSRVGTRLNFEYTVWQAVP